MMYSLAPASMAFWMCSISFSVVQNTTIGTSPPGVALSALRNSMPSITGMFQSSSTPSGILRLQASRASLPSAASSISNSSSWSIFRATKRMTLESSTTRQVFMALFGLFPNIESRSAFKLGCGRRDEMYKLNQCCILSGLFSTPDHVRPGPRRQRKPAFLTRRFSLGNGKPTA